MCPASSYPDHTMGIFAVDLKPAVGAIFFSCAAAFAASADEVSLDSLFQNLKSAEKSEAQKAAREIELEWSKSGSASANLLFKRGEKALDDENPSEAVEHFTALTDHAPEFSEGWHGRARAFFMLGEYGLALNDLKPTLALNPRHFDAIYGLAAILEQIKKPEEAYDAYKILLDIYPAHEKALEAITRLERSVNGTNL